MSGRAPRSEGKGRGNDGLADWKRLLVLCVVSLGVFANSAFGGFVFDDHEAIVNNPDVRYDSPFWNIFLNDYWGTPLSDPESHGSYRPLTILTFRWNHWMGGVDPWGYHIVNILLHSCVCMLLYWVLVQTQVERDIGFLATLLFTVHPIHTEAVANIVGRAEILSAIFYLISLYSFLKFSQTCDNVGWPINKYCALLWMVLVQLSALIAMLCKEQGVTCLGVCALFHLFKDWSAWKRNHFILSIKKALFVPSIVVTSSLALIVSRIWIAGGRLPSFTAFDNPTSFSDSPLTRVLTYAYLACYNFWLLLCPSRLCFDWSMGSIPFVESIADWRNLFTVLLFVLLTGVGVLGVSTRAVTNGLIARIVNPFNLQQRTAIFLGLLLMVIPFLPVSNLLFTVGFVIAERVLYLPSMGFCLLVAMGTRVLQEYEVRGLKGRRYHLSTLVKYAVSFLLLILSLKSFVRNNEWKDSESLALAGLRTNPLNAKIYATMGNTLVEKGNLRCMDYYRKALEINSNYTIVWSNMGLVYTNTERLHEAEECYRKALSIQPDHVNANTNMGHLLRRQGRWNEALSHFTVASNRRPLQFDLHYLIGLVNMEIGNTKQAEKNLETALNLNPNYPEAHFALGKLFTSVNRSTKAITHLHRGLQLLPDSSIGHLYMGRLLLSKGNYDSAEKHLLLSVEYSPDSAEANNELLKLYNKLNQAKQLPSEHI